MGKWTKKWKEKSDRTLGNPRGKEIFSKMLSEQDRTLMKALIMRRQPRPDNHQIRDALDLI